MSKVVSLDHSSWSADGATTSGRSTLENYGDMYKVAVKAHSELTGEAQATSLSEKFYYRIPTPAAPLMNIDSQDIKLASQEEVGL